MKNAAGALAFIARFVILGLALAFVANESQHLTFLDAGLPLTRLSRVGDRDFLSHGPTCSTR